MRSLVKGQQEPAQTNGATLRVQFRTLAEFQEHYLKDFSRGSIFVWAKATHPLGKRIVVLVNLPDGEEVSLQGRVVHVHDRGSLSYPVGMGIEILDPAPELIMKLDPYINHPKRSSPAPLHMPNEAALAQIVDLKTRSRNGHFAARPGAVGEEIELLRRFCWVLARGLLPERSLEYILGVPGGAPKRVRREIYQRLRHAVELDRPPVFLGPADAGHVERKLVAIASLVEQGE